jgi:hypothetical protein
LLESIEERKTVQQTIVAKSRQSQQYRSTRELDSDSFKRRQDIEALNYLKKTLGQTVLTHDLPVAVRQSDSEGIQFVYQRAESSFPVQVVLSSDCLLTQAAVKDDLEKLYRKDSISSNPALPDSDHARPPIR